MPRRRPRRPARGGALMTPRDSDFRTFITPIKHPRFDWRVTVTRLSDGTTKTDRASGGWTAAEAVAMRLQTELTEVSR